MEKFKAVITSLESMLVNSYNDATTHHNEHGGVFRTGATMYFHYAPDYLLNDIQINDKTSSREWESKMTFSTMMIFSFKWVVTWLVHIPCTCTVPPLPCQGTLTVSVFCFCLIIFWPYNKTLPGLPQVQIATACNLITLHP